ncbi:hypothetical protein [Dankookia sp. P2]|uniref:hypothetical protein n=1 Tax=Dankookia sp. P2 TaxID=3423955 RepID=UPI003D66B685
MDTDRILSLTDPFHEAALEPGFWPEALAQLGDAFGGASALLATNHHDGGPHLLEASRCDRDLFARFAAEHGSAEENDYIRQLNAMRAGEVLWRQAVVPDHAWMADPIYRNFLRPQQLWDGLVTPLVKDTAGYAVVGLYRARAFEDGETALLRAIAPHLQRALRVATRLGALRDRLGASLTALDALAPGIVLADKAGRVLHANAAARAILAEADGLALARGGALRTARTAEASALARLIAGAAAVALRRDGLATAAGERAADGGGALALPRPSGRAALSVLVAPLRRAASAGGWGSRAPPPRRSSSCRIRSCGRCPRRRWSGGCTTCRRPRPSWS